MFFEKCGLIVICGEHDEKLGGKVFDGLCSLQHRGQESAGIALFATEVQLIKQRGLVKDVFAPYDNLLHYGGRIALGHVRYGHEGETDKETQPIALESPLGTIYLAYNGCISNRDELLAYFSNTSTEKHDNITDLECIGYTLIHDLSSGMDIISALKSLHKLVKGAFCLIVIINETVYCLRDKYGFRPLCFGRTKLGQYVFASETCALNAVEATLVREILPGEIIVCNGTNNFYDNEFCGKAPNSLCCFEYFYFADRTSVVGGNLVSKIRCDAGRVLARKAPIDCDVVIGVPNSGKDAAKGYAKELGLPYSEGFKRNKEIHRTFIVPNQKERERLVQAKLTVIKEVVNGKEIVVVDDSIVRGTTVMHIVKLLRNAGAKRIHMRICSPKFIFDCPYGTEIGKRETLIAYNRTTEEIAEIIGVDSLGYLEPKDIDILVGADNSVCKACFDGKYPNAE